MTPASLFVARFVANHTHKFFKEQTETRGEQTAFAEEAIGGLKTVQAFAHEDENAAKFDEINARLERATMNATFYSSLTNPSTRFINNLVYALVALLGAFDVIGGAFTVLGSKAMGADVVYALDTAEIGPLSTEASVAFVWNDRVSLDTERTELETRWRATLSSPVSAAFRGEVDDIIPVDEMRQRVISSLYMLADKGVEFVKRHAILPL